MSEKNSTQSINFIHFILCSVHIKDFDCWKWQFWVHTITFSAWIKWRDSESVRELGEWRRKKLTYYNWKDVVAFVNHSSRSIQKMDQWKRKRKKFDFSLQIYRKELKVSSSSSHNNELHFFYSNEILLIFFSFRDDFFSYSASTYTHTHTKKKLTEKQKNI